MVCPMSVSFGCWHRLCAYALALPWMISIPGAVGQEVASAPASSDAVAPASVVTAQTQASESATEIPDSHPRAWFPESSVMYAELAPLDRWSDHPLREWLTSTEAFKKIWRSPEVMKARGGLLLAEYAIGTKLEVLLRDLSHGGVVLVVDRETEGVALLARTRSEEWLSKYADKALDFIRSDAKNNGREDPVKSAEYKGIRGYQIQNGIFASIGPWLLVTNKSELAQSIIDRMRDPALGNLESAKWLEGFPEIETSLERPAGVRVAAMQIDLDQVRQLEPDNDLFRAQAKDFGAELILGGVLSVLRNASSAQGVLELDADGVQLELSTPCDPAWFGETREYFVGPAMQGHAPAPLAIEDSIATLSSYRNVSELWLRAGDLFDQNVNDDLAQAENTLTTLFSGKDFAMDILGAIEPEVQIVTVPQAFANDALAPSVKLPAFALVAKLKKPDVMQRELKRTFQSFLGFLNVVGAMEGMPQLDQNMERIGEHTLYSAEYISDADRKYDNGLPIQFNFSPAIAFVDDYVVLSSTTALARRLATQTWEPAMESAALRDSNTFLTLDFQALQKILESNENALVTQNMLEKGSSKVEATKEIEMLMSGLKLLRQGWVRLVFDERASLRLRVDAMQP